MQLPTVLLLSCSLASAFRRKNNYHSDDNSDSSSTGLFIQQKMPGPNKRGPMNDNSKFVQELAEFRKELYPEAHMYNSNPILEIETSGQPIRAKALEAKWLPVQVLSYIHVYPI